VRHFEVCIDIIKSRKSLADEIYQTELLIEDLSKRPGTSEQIDELERKKVEDTERLTSMTRNFKYDVKLFNKMINEEIKILLKKYIST